MRFRRERNWRQLLESSRRLTELSSPWSLSKINSDLVDTLRQFHQQDLRAFENTRQEERAEDKQERQQEKQERAQDRATTHRMVAAIERSHQTLADLMGRQTSAMEAIATAFSAPRYPSSSSFPGYNMHPGFSPPWSAQQSVPNSSERQASPSGNNAAPQSDLRVHIPATTHKDAEPNLALPAIGPSTDFHSEPDLFPALLIPSPEELPGSPPAVPDTLSTSPKRGSKRKKCV